MSCGNVGQSFNFFRPNQTVESVLVSTERAKYYAPCRIPSSSRISKCVNSTFCSRRSAVIFFENPHRGESGLPFINSTTLLWFIRACILASSSSGVSYFSVTADAFAGERCVFDWGVIDGFEAWVAIAAVSAGASAPVTRPRSVCPYCLLVSIDLQKETARPCVRMLRNKTYPENDKRRYGFDLKRLCNI